MIFTVLREYTHFGRSACIAQNARLALFAGWPQRTGRAGRGAMSFGLYPIGHFERMV